MNAYSFFPYTSTIYINIVFYTTSHCMEIQSRLFKFFIKAIYLFARNKRAFWNSTVKGNSVCTLSIFKIKKKKKNLMKLNEKMYYSRIIEDLFVHLGKYNISFVTTLFSLYKYLQTFTNNNIYPFLNNRIPLWICIRTRRVLLFYTLISYHSMVPKGMYLHLHVYYTSFDITSYTNFALVRCTKFLTYYISLPI